MTNRLMHKLIFLVLIFIGCTKNETSFYEDSEKSGLSIFSNTGNNLLTCRVNNSVWVTRNRISTLVRKTYEIDIEKQKTLTVKDTLIITWKGNSDNYNFETLVLHLAVDSNFTSKDFISKLNGKRIIIDSTVNGYFTTTINKPLTPTNFALPKGNGVLFFQKFTENKLAGLLNTKIENNVITDGRFDHDIDKFQLNF